MFDSVASFEVQLSLHTPNTKYTHATTGVCPRVGFTYRVSSSRCVQTNAGASVRFDSRTQSLSVSSKNARFGGFGRLSLLLVHKGVISVADMLYSIRSSIVRQVNIRYERAGGAK